MPGDGHAKRLAWRHNDFTKEVQRHKRTTWLSSYNSLFVRVRLDRCELANSPPSEIACSVLHFLFLRIEKANSKMEQGPRGHVSSQISDLTWTSPTRRIPKLTVSVENRRRRSHIIEVMTEGTSAPARTVPHCQQPRVEHGKFEN
jgi:hypothetical protein